MLEFNMLECQDVRLSAFRTCDVKPTLIAVLQLRPDCSTLVRRRACDYNLAPISVCLCPLVNQVYRVALARKVFGVFVNLIHENIADRL